MEPSCSCVAIQVVNLRGRGNNEVACVCLTWTVMTWSWFARLFIWALDLLSYYQPCDTGPETCSELFKATLYAINRRYDSLPHCPAITGDCTYQTQQVLLHWKKILRCICLVYGLLDIVITPSLNIVTIIYWRYSSHIALRRILHDLSVYAKKDSLF